MEGHLKRALLVVAFLLFVVEAFGVSGPLNLVPAGLAFWVLSSIL